MMMTVKEVAEALGVSERSVWRWSATGILPPGIKIGASVRWREETIEQWLAKQEQQALAEQRALAEKTRPNPGEASCAPAARGQPDDYPHEVKDKE